MPRASRRELLERAGLRHERLVIVESTARGELVRKLTPDEEARARACSSLLSRSSTKRCWPCPTRAGGRIIRPTSARYGPGSRPIKRKLRPPRPRPAAAEACVGTPRATDGSPAKTPGPRSPPSQDRVHAAQNPTLRQQPCSRHIPRSEPTRCPRRRRNALRSALP